jgi:predicted membrane protein
VPVVLVLVRALYYKITPRKEYLFTYILISMVVYFMIMLLENVGVEIGFALGLFAIFGMLRYRTQQIPIREMTYLFLVIGVSVINSLANRRVSYAELLLTNAAIVLITYLLEKVFLMKTETKKLVFYEKIELIKPDMREEMIADLKERTGLPIHRVEIDRIDYLRDSARIFIFYFEKDWRNVGNAYQPGDNDD